MRRIYLVLLVTVLSCVVGVVDGQSDFAATLEVLDPLVTVQRVNTVNPIEVAVEAIVGVGDVITTGEEGRARITFFADGTSTELEPNTIYRIDEFKGDDESFTLRVSVIIGQTSQQLERALDANSSYEIDTPGMTLAARGTIFAIRVEESGRAGMLVREGTVEADADSSTADVPAEFGVRSETDAALSDIVRASTFAELDAALDGCTIQVRTSDDVSLNVRLGPALEQPQIGFVAAGDIVVAIGRNTSGNWYRFAFAGGYGWFLSTSASIDSACAGLRVFPDDQREDPDSYNETVTVTIPPAQSIAETGD